MAIEGFFEMDALAKGIIPQPFDKSGNGIARFRNDLSFGEIFFLGRKRLVSNTEAKRKIIFILQLITVLYKRLFGLLVFIAQK